VKKIQKIEEDKTTTLVENDENDDQEEREEEVSEETASLLTEEARHEAFLDCLKESREAGDCPFEFLSDIGYEDLATWLKYKRIEDVYGFLEAILVQVTDPLPLLDELQLHGREEIYHRRKLDHIQTKEDVIPLIRNAKQIIVISGAGISVSCGIPDFRSPGGLYDQINEKFNLDDPHLLFDINYLKSNPVPFFEFAKQLFPNSELQPSCSHRFIKELEKQNKLLRHYTQNIDMLEKVCGIKNTVQCHGSFETATCITCKSTVSGMDIRDHILHVGIPYCKQCNDGKSFMKPNIVFFGEALPEEFQKIIAEDCQKCDLLLVIGSSLRVYPVGYIPRLIGEVNPNIPQILINNEIVAKPHEWDYFFEGTCDGSVKEIAKMLSWKDEI